MDGLVAFRVAGLIGIRSRHAKSRPMPEGAPVTNAKRGRLEEIIASSFYAGIVERKARVSATMRSWNFGSRTRAEPSIGWPLSS